LNFVHAFWALARVWADSWVQQQVLKAVGNEGHAAVPARCGDILDGWSLASLFKAMDVRKTINFNNP